MGKTYKHDPYGEDSKQSPKHLKKQSKQERTRGDLSTLDGFKEDYRDMLEFYGLPVLDHELS